MHLLTTVELDELIYKLTFKFQTLHFALFT